MGVKMAGSKEMDQKQNCALNDNSKEGAEDSH